MKLSVHDNWRRVFLIKRETVFITIAALLVITPALFMVMLYHTTKNPLFRPLGITLERMIEAGQMSDRTLIITNITIGPDARDGQSLDAYREAFTKSFGGFNTETRVRFRNAERGSAITVHYEVGNSVIGPFPIARAADGIRSAVEAERMVTKQRAIQVRKDQAEQQNGSFWVRIMSDQ